MPPMQTVRTLFELGMVAISESMFRRPAVPMMDFVFSLLKVHKPEIQAFEYDSTDVGVAKIVPIPR